MAREHKVRRVDLRVVTAGERAEQEGLVDHFDLRFGGRVTCSAIVVATHQGHGHMGVVRAPGCHRSQQIGCATGGGVQEVTEEHDVFRLVLRDQAGDARQVVLRAAARDGLPQGAVAGGFAEVQVGDEEGFCCGPLEGWGGE